MAVGIELAVIAVVYVLFSMFLQRKIVDMKRMRKVQELIKTKSKELNDMAKNQASKETLEAKQKEVTELLGQSMKSSFKPLFVVLPIFFVLYYLLLPAAFPHNLTFTLPFLSTVSYQTYFIVIAFIVGIVLSAIVMVWDRMQLAKEKRAEQLAAAAEQPRQQY